MATEPLTELEAFHRFVGQRLRQNGRIQTLDDCLDEWRRHQSELEDSVAAIHRALRQLDAGEGTPLDEFDRQFRETHGMPPPDA